MLDKFIEWSSQFELILKEQNPDFKNITDYRNLVDVKPGTEEAKLVDEAIEFALVRIVREGWDVYKDDPMQLLALSDYHPRLTTRTGDSLRSQAFSTPILISVLASKLLSCTAETTVYEPTAGMGALLVAVDPKLAQVNELDLLRSQALSLQGFTVTRENALTWYPDETFDRIILNPPFGKMREGIKKPYLNYLFDQRLAITDLDALITFVALHQLKPQGKAVLIVKGVLGRSQEDRGIAYASNPQRVEFFNLLYDNYNVVDHVTLSGELYQKQGASYPVDLIIIDGKSTSKLKKPHEKTPIIIRNKLDLIDKKWQNINIKP